jgi:predicted Zn-dependent protease
MPKWVLAMALVAGACALNPATGERQLALISEAHEIELGRQAARQVEQTIGLVDDRALQDYVRRIGNALAAASERPSLPWRFAVVDDPTPNAFALPGGPVYLTRGMMNLMDSEAELASVLGHEIGHITARHAVSMISRQQLTQLGLGLGGVFYPPLQPFGPALGAGLELLFLKYGRDAERQADTLGFRYAGRENYDLDEMVDVFASLGRMGELAQRSPLPSWLSTHPEPEARIERVRAMLAEAPAANEGRIGRDAYLTRLDSLVYGQNPRHGFFRDGVFYHPDLRFRFRVPEGWQAQNISQAVLASDPRGSAALQLTLVGNLPPDEATRRFLAQPGIQGLDSGRESLNGLPARVTVFDAHTEGGIIRGMLAHVGYRGRTYQLAAYSTPGNFGAYQRTFERVVGSFGAVSDPDVLQIQPNRMDVTRLSRTMTVEEFSRVHGSAVPTRELAILNQVPGEDSPLRAGTLVKRVVG